MFTVKHVESTGQERVFETVSVERNLDGALVFGSVIRTGKVYVMNDAGKTVAVYDFKKEQEHV